MTWQAFGTAPRDGTHFILCNGDGWVGEAYWDAEAERCYAANTHSTDYYDGGVDDPRLWQPLPKPPAIFTRKRGTKEEAR
jgi:hypothetical protein